MASAEYYGCMDRVEQIEAAIAELPPEDFSRLEAWFRALLQNRWDEELDRDSAAGKLDFLFEEAETEYQQNAVREWPPRS